MPTATYGIHAAKTRLSQLVEDALAGIEVIISRNGQPVVRLEVIGDAAPLKPRIGGLKGRTFNAVAFEAMDAKIADLFEAKL
ncbi:MULTISPECIES: type II toxin-antitoxin system Phd/YefM family antitoxin [Pseudomonas]|uniref:Type II toxin-antitoxin system prevent-host-death family antitoxin n=1 Tax=Pseudomonas quercus TaxID=2722792 RepID=A0ABX0YJ07_9PSED|nr:MULTISPECIES: type II toxin-antitoxin system prevent-host-death family antitoxin [Pseudomonas]MBF7144844.1 type II toxin-antitoxin system prevent-host-death family antitoxin [Pseudomonas sp. LY10J]NJP03380.1 type II toxin-antitoxin system prevent-host-death family antitoxin [Pseudomonas quercus]